jgi:hypothetical protein
MSAQKGFITDPEIERNASIVAPPSYRDRVLANRPARRVVHAARRARFLPNRSNAFIDRMLAQERVDRRAACLPSRIAQTTSDWPRRMSPAANTALATLVR